MAKLILLCNLERLKAWDDGSDLAFGFNLSVALDEDVPLPDDASKSLLKTAVQPWKWTRPKSLKLYQFDSNGILLKDQALKAAGFDVPLDPISVDFVPQTLPDLSELEKRLENKKLPESWDGTDQVPLKMIKNGSSYKVRNDQKKPWPALIGKLSTYPYPVPQGLNLSYLFHSRLDATFPADGFLAAVPVLEAGSFPASQSIPKLGVMLAGKVQTFDYAIPEMSTQAQVALCPKSIPAGVFIDPESLWIKNSDSTPFEDDWLSMLETRMADAIDLSTWVLDFLSQPPSGIGQADVTRCVDLAIAAMADIAGPGLVAPPDGVSLLESLGISAADKQKLDARYASLYDLDGWKRMLADALSQSGRTVSLAILQVPPPGFPVQLQQAVSELRILHGALLEGGKEQISGNVALSKTLLQLVQAQWTRLFALGNVTADAGKLAAALDNSPRDIRSQLALSHLGRYWPQFIKCNSNNSTTDGTKLILDGFPVYCLYYLLHRCKGGFTPGNRGLVTPSAPILVPAPIGGISDDIQNKLAAFVNDRADAVAKKLLPGGTAGPTSVPHAATLQIDRLDASGATDDLLKRISGIGVLMRRQGDASPNWCCLNVGDLHYRDSLNNDQKIVSPAIIPYRIVYRHGLRQVCVNYNNAPLGCDTPLTEADMSGWTQVKDATPVDPLITHKYTASTDVKIPRLEYGKTYDFVAFAISNCGALPYELTSKTIAGAAQVSFPISASVTQNLTPKTLTYLRRVPIGALRLCDPADPTYQAPVKFPPIPANVFPRAREIATLNTWQTTYAAAVSKGQDPNSTDAAAPHAQMPLGLLTERCQADCTSLPGMTSFEMNVLLPGTNWDTWDRWPGMADADRRVVIAAYYRLAQKNNTTSKNKDLLTVDDPAVAPMIYVELLKCDEKGDLRPVDKAFVDVPNVDLTKKDAKPSGIGGKKAGVLVHCECSPSAEKIEAITKGIKVSILKGGVYRLGIYALVSPTSKALFGAGDGVFTAAMGPITGSDGNSYIPVSPTYIALEAATPELPEADSLWGTLKVPPRASDRFVVSLEPDPKAPDSAAYRNIGRVYLSREVWRWQGRDTAWHPQLLTNPDILNDPENLKARIQEWEAREFGDRAPSDSGSPPMLSTQGLPDGTRKFSFQETISNGKGPDPRSLHFRFAIRAVSRYEGFLSPKDSYRDGEVAIQPAGDPLVLSGWKSTFVPCRFKGEVPQPKVRLILPLTELGSANSDTSPGLLVVLDEPWHEIGGLAERLEARVATTTNPFVAGATDSFTELGPDPIVFNGIPMGSKTLLDAPSPEARAAIPTRFVQGPVGHYFDASNSSARFLATSFILPAPERVPSISDPGPILGDFRHHMVKLQFRRILVTATDLQIDQNPEWIRVKDAIKSSYTDPIWAQYLPAFSVFEKVPLTGTGTAIRLQADPNTPQLFLWKDDGSPLRLQSFPEENSIPTFSLYAVLTSRVFDITGRPDQERYMGLFSQDLAGNSWTIVEGEIPQAAPGFGVRVRIIEVQRPKPRDVNVTKTLWDELFSQSGEDTGARIVRISEPIDGAAQPVVCEGK